MGFIPHYFGYPCTNQLTLAKDGVLEVEDFLDLIQPPDNEEPPCY